MKNIIKISSVFILTFGLSLQFQSTPSNGNLDVEVGTKVANAKVAAGCTQCSSSSQECHRVIVGNTVHIFYGDASDCDEQIEE